MTSQNFPREQVIKLVYLPRKAGLTLRKRGFMSRIVLFDRKFPPPPPMSISAIIKQRIFSFLKFLGRLDEERAAATLLIDQFC